MPATTGYTSSQSSMDATLCERLIRAEQRFLLAVVSNDEESLEAFSQEWSQLGHDIKSIKTAGQLDDNTALLLSKVSRAIENTTLCMSETGAMLQETQTCSISDFVQDISFGDPSIASLHPQAFASCRLLFSNLSCSINPRILGENKLLDSYAYRWLTQNIYDPYPNSVQTRTIGDVSGTSAAQVKLWFQEVRDSIGWSKLSHDFFAGSVNATVAAARRVYLEHDKDMSFDIMFAFTAVKTFAETLFSERPFSQGKDIDAGPTWAPRTMAMDLDYRMESFPDELSIDPNSIPVPLQVDLPAPADTFSDFTDSDESEEEDTTPPPSIAGSKRRLTEDMLTSQVNGMGRPQKRHRCVFIFPFAVPSG